MAYVCALSLRCRVCFCVRSPTPRASAVLVGLRACVVLFCFDFFFVLDIMMCACDVCVVYAVFFVLHIVHGIA